MTRFGDEVVLDDPAFVHPSAQIYGKARLGPGASMWPNSVIRAEMHAVEVGAYSNIQDMVMIHVGYNSPTVIGAYCSITHHCTIHGARIGNNCLIGINATVMDHCDIGDNSIVAGGAFLTEGTKVPANSIVIGAPAKVARSRNNWVMNRFNALVYHRNAVAYAQGDHRAWHGPEFETFIRDTMDALREEFREIHGVDDGSQPIIEV